MLLPLWESNQPHLQSDRCYCWQLNLVVPFNSCSCRWGSFLDFCATSWLLNHTLDEVPDGTLPPQRGVLVLAKTFPNKPSQQASRCGPLMLPLKRSHQQAACFLVSSFPLWKTFWHNIHWSFIGNMENHEETKRTGHATGFFCVGPGFGDVFVHRIEVFVVLHCIWLYSYVVREHLKPSKYLKLHWTCPPSCTLVVAWGWVHRVHWPGFFGIAGLSGTPMGCYGLLPKNISGKHPLVGDVYTSSHNHGSQTWVYLQ